MDERMIEITNWYNDTLDRHVKNKAEFNTRFTGANGLIALSTTDIAINYGRLCKEYEMLNQVLSILITDPRLFNIPDNIADIEEL